ncbi:MAG: alanine racemase [Phycisphaerales bacterium]|jgi:alanine racemase
MPPTSAIRIDLAAIDANVAAIRRMVGPGCRLCPIVKADAYGLGAARVARRLAPTSSLLAVYSPEQAVALAEERVGVPSLVLMPVRSIRRGDDLETLLAGGGIHLSIHDEPQVASLAASARRLGIRIPVHVEIDTGLRRGGVECADAGSLLRSVVGQPALRLAGVMTHFSDSKRDPERTQAQLAAFDAVLASVELPETCLVHVSSTHALLRHRRYHRGMVRFGLAWAGYGHEDLDVAGRIEGSTDLRPAISWSSGIVHVKRIAPGDGVGYGSTWIAKRPTVVGLVPVGYADGFPVDRGGAAGRVVLLPRDLRDGQRLEAPVIGAVSMDQITIDLTDAIAAAGVASSRLDSVLEWGVELIGTDPDSPTHLPTIAARAGMLPHELLCRLGARIPRVHIAGGAVNERGEPAVPIVETRRIEPGSASLRVV